MNVYIVIIDNGDTEPELWAFRELPDAETFAASRAIGATVVELPLLGHGEALQVIADEREMP